MADSGKTVCEITRQAVREAPQCACPNDKLIACRDVAVAPDSCTVFKIAEYQEKLFNEQYSPGKSSTVRKATLTNLATDIKSQEQILQDAFGKGISASDCQYWKMQRCLSNANGSKNGFGRTYIGRQELETVGYAPAPIIHASFLDQKLPPNLTDLVPIMVDRVMNPELAIVVILVIIIGILWALIASVSKWKKGAYARNIRRRDKEIEQKEASDPWKFMSPTYVEDPNDKWRLLIPQYEAQGYCMEAYRKKLGMPEGPKCS